MQIEMRSLDQIKPYPGNPRDIDGGVDAVANSLREFGWQQPIVVDEQGIVLAGHTRLKAARKLGMDKIPVHVARGLTPAQARAFRVVDNQSSALSHWDMELLTTELAGLKELNFNMEILGFSTDELDR